MKVCNKCGKEKFLEEFCKTGSYCKKCMKEYCKKRNVLNNRKIKDYNKQYKQTHKGEIKEYYQKNKKHIISYTTKYNKQYRVGYFNQYNKNHKKQKKIWAKKKYNSDSSYKLKSNIRSRIYGYLKSNKTHHSIEYLGCTIKFYKQYIEQQFTPEMNWENYGRYWELDHLKQLCTFDLINEKEQFKAFNYKNTRPLEKIANRSRSKRD